jgi:hypothetical protein
MNKKIKEFQTQTQYFLRGIRTHSTWNFAGPVHQISIVVTVSKSYKIYQVAGSNPARNSFARWVFRGSL